MLKYSIIIILTSCFSSSLLKAQNIDKEPPSDPKHLPNLPKAKEGDRICRCISTFNFKKKEALFIKLDKTYHEVALAGEALSAAFPVRGSAVFKLYNKVTNEEDEVIYVPIVEQSLTGVGEDFIITLYKTNNKLRSKAYNISKSNYPVNSIHIFNESPVALGFQVDEFKTLVKPLERYSYRVKKPGRNTYASTKIVMDDNGEKKVMAYRRLRLIAGRRVLLFCFPSKTRAKMGSTPLRVLKIQDMP